MSTGSNDHVHDLLIGGQQLSRRAVLRLIGVAGVGAVGLAACGSSHPAATSPTASASSASYGPVSFWDMEWGTTSYSKAGETLTAQFNATHKKGPKVSYTPISWSNWYEKFATAISSGTAPDCSSGAAYQPFQFYPKGAIQPVDSIVAAMAKSGELADFYPSTLEWMKYDGHYVALPFEIDLRVFYYRKSLLSKAGVAVPKTWDDILTAGRALKKLGVFGFGFSGTTSDSGGWQIVMSMILNNGGGLFAPDGTLDCVTPANLQTIEFLQQLAREKIIDPAAPGYPSTEIARIFGSGDLAMTWSPSNWPPSNLPASIAADTYVLPEPLVSPSGNTGTIHWVNPVMVYKQHPTAFAGDSVWLQWYLQHLGVYFADKYLTGIPVTKSIANLASVKSNRFISVPTAKWLPVAKTTANFYPHIVPALNVVEGSPPLYDLAESIVTSKSSAKQLLTKLQAGLAQAIGSDHL